MFRTATIAAVVATASYVAADEPETNTICYEGAYDSIFPLDMDVEECNGMNIFRKVNDNFKAARTADHAANSGSRAARKNRIQCKGGSKYEFAVLTGVDDATLNAMKAMPTSNDAEKAAFNSALAVIFEESLDTIGDFCENALRTASEVFGEQGWGTVEGAGVDLEEFFAGKGFLNEETGNFQQDPAKFKDNRDKFIYMGDDPRLNDHYPTSEESYQAGLAINDMYTDESRQSWFTQPKGIGNCASNTAMCCWHRDRQYFDDNGNCNAPDCANQNPSDNTDLCWTELGKEIFPYPGSDTEKQLHCHGLAWSNDESGVDMNAKGKWNTLFYVSMYDHLKQRGYAESIGADPKIMSEQAMCGCVEEMAPVARADCSEIVGTAKYTASLSDSGVIDIDPVDGTFELAFQACKGFKYVDITQEEFESTTRLGALGLRGKNNDLSAFVFRHWLERKITDEQVATVEETLIGYKNPNGVGNDAGRAVACEEAFNARFPNLTYEEKAIE